jgi:hypothetical protein
LQLDHHLSSHTSLACQPAPWLLGCCTHSERQARVWQARNKVARCFLGSRHGGYWSRDVLMDLSPIPRWLCFRGTSSSAGMQPPACSTALQQQPSTPFHQPKSFHTYPGNQGTKEPRKPRLLIHGRRLLRTNEHREGNCFSLSALQQASSDVYSGPRPRPASMLLRFLQLQSRVRA